MEPQGKEQYFVRSQSQTGILYPDPIDTSSQYEEEKIDTSSNPRSVIRNPTACDEQASSFTQEEDSSISVISTENSQIGENNH